MYNIKRKGEYNGSKRDINVKAFILSILYIGYIGLNENLRRIDSGVCNQGSRTEKLIDFFLHCRT